jgi:hypothetical protein
LKTIGQKQVREAQLAQEGMEMGQSRKADASVKPARKNGGKK